jgi:hypothetical protein
MGSKSILEHILRGIGGIALLAVGLIYLDEIGWWAAVPIVAAILLFRGCPMCWLVGLIDTVISRKTPPKCTDGSC